MITTLRRNFPTDQLQPQSPFPTISSQIIFAPQTPIPVFSSFNMSSESNAVGPSVFLPEAHPELKSIGQKAIYDFLKDRAAYEQRVASANAQGSTFPGIALKDSIDTDLLKSLIELDTFSGVLTL